RFEEEVRRRLLHVRNVGLSPSFPSSPKTSSIRPVPNEVGTVLPLPKKLERRQTLAMTTNTGEPETVAPTIQRRGRVPADTFSNRLTLARKLEGLTIERAVAQIYEVTGVKLGESSWANWEQGMRPHREIDVIQAIAWGLDVDE